MNEEHELSESSQSLLSGLFVSERAPQMPTEEQLIRFALGAMDEAEHEILAAALVRSPNLRARAIEMRRDLAGLGAEPFERAKEKLSPDVREAVERALASVVRCYARFGEWCAGMDWPEMSGSWIVRPALAAIGDSMKMANSGPRFATARGGTDRFVFGEGLESLTRPYCSVEISRSGDLIAELHPDDPALEGKDLALEWIDPAGGAVPLGTAKARAGRWRLEVPGFADVSSLTAGVLPASAFRISAKRSLERLEVRNHLFAAVQNGEAVALEVTARPLMQDGYLTVGLSLSDSLRRVHADRLLQLGLVVGQIRILMGSWKVSDWTTDELEFRFPLPVDFQGTLECGSILHAQLI